MLQVFRLKRSRNWLNRERPDDNGETMGVAGMCKVLEDMRKEVAEEAAREAEERKSIEIALRLISDGRMSFEEIAGFTALPLEKVRELAQQRTA